MCPGSRKKELVEDVGLSPGLLALSSGFSYRLHSLGSTKPWGGHSALEWCSPRPALPLLPGKCCPYPLPDKPGCPTRGKEPSWQPLVGIQVELLFPVPSLAHDMASSSNYVLPDRPQLLASGAFCGQRELGSNWAQSI